MTSSLQKMIVLVAFQSLSWPVISQVTPPVAKLTCNFSYFQVKNGGAKATTPVGLNDAGAVVGGWNMPGNYEGAFERSAKGKITTYQRSNYVDTAFYGINDSGWIVGSSDTGQLFTNAGFLRKNGKYTSINYPGAVATVANGINNHGVIVGTFWDQSYYTHGFVLESGKYKEISYPKSNFTGPAGINDQGVIVGEYIENRKPLPHIHGFVWNKGKFQSIDFNREKNLYDTTLTSINTKGAIVGWYEQTDDSPGVAFEYAGGTFKVIDVPQSTNTGAQGINKNGQVTGSAYRNSQLEGFLGKNCH